MRINTNISAFIANKNLQQTQGRLSGSLEKLSSGYRINQSADDSAGMAIAAKLRTQIRGLDQASRNASDGISVVQTAEGALNEITSLLQRMRELSVQAATGSLVDEDREAINDEVQALAEEVDRISRDTEFNKKTLLDGSLDRRSYTDQNNIRVSYASGGVPAGNYIITVLNKGAEAIVNGEEMMLSDSDEITEDLAGTIVINEYNIDVMAGETASEVYAKLTEACDRLNITVGGFADNKLTFTTYEAGSTETLKIDISNDKLAASLGLNRSYEVYGVDAEVTFDSVPDIKATEAKVAGGEMKLTDSNVITDDNAGTITINDKVVDIEAGATATEVYEKLAEACDELNITVGGFAENKLTFTTNEAGAAETIKIEVSNDNLAEALGLNRNYEEYGTDADPATEGVQREGFSESAILYTNGNTVTVTDVGGFQLIYEIDPAYTGEGTQVNADVTDIGTMLVHIGANENQVIDICIPEISTESLGIDYINCLTSNGASKAITLLDKAINKVSSVRSEIGACQNRLDAANSSIAVTSFNMEASLSRIEDVDMAEEMATYTQLNVLSQAGVSMVAQANELPQMVLQLIQ